MIAVEQTVPTGRFNDKQAVSMPALDEGFYTLWIPPHLLGLGLR